MNIKKWEAQMTRREQKIRQRRYGKLSFWNKAKWLFFFFKDRLRTSHYLLGFSSPFIFHHTKFLRKYFQKQNIWRITKIEKKTIKKTKVLFNCHWTAPPFQNNFQTKHSKYETRPLLIPLLSYHTFLPYFLLPKWVTSSYASYSTPVF